MGAFVALLRAVNVGGTGKLPMAELKALCEELGLAQVRTYIASGNVVFASDRSESEIRNAIAAELFNRYGKSIGVLVRSAAELAELAAGNPWPDRPGNRVVAIFVDDPLSLDGIAGQRGEVVQLGNRAIYVDFAEGQADSRLRIPCAKAGTARNMNTVRKLAEMASEL